MSKSQNIYGRHGLTNTPEYNSWRSIRDRCLNPTNKNYPRWGGRGIKICDRWQGKYGFVNFLEDVGTKPTPQHSIERIDNDGDYEPDNVKWATKTEQAFNRRVFKNNKSGIPGISFDNRSGTWVVRKTIGLKQRKLLGYFKELEDAKAALVAS